MRSEGVIGKRKREIGDVDEFERMYKEAQKDFYVVGFAAWQTNNGAVLLVHFRIHLGERLTQSSDFYFRHRCLSVLCSHYFHSHSKTINQFR